MSDLAAGAMTRVPQVLVNATLKSRRPLDQMPKTSSAIRAAEAKLGDGGRVLVRWSGTEPKLRVMVEGEDDASIRTLAEEIIAVARQELA